MNEVPSHVVILCEDEECTQPHHHIKPVEEEEIEDLFEEGDE